MHQPDYLGKTFFKLKVIGKREIYRSKFRWLCQCECGRVIECMGAYLRKGYNKSCGCWTKPREKIDVNARFWKYVEKTDYCWNWIGSFTATGYGQFSFNGKPWKAPRFSWTIFNGKIPDKLFVCHKCDNPKCVNPDHLFLGSQKDNMRDMCNKGRQSHLRGSKVYSSKLKEEDIVNIRNLYANGNNSRQIAELYFVNKCTIMNIINKVSWKHV